MRSFIAASLTLAATACARPPFPPNTGAIVEQELFNRATCGRLQPLEGPAWTPTPDVIQRLEIALFDHLVPKLERDAEDFQIEAHAPEDYIRRYFGFEHDGRRLIAICGEEMGMYDRAGLDWRTHYIPYRDGGSSSFGAYYDPSTDQVIYFEFGYVG